MQGLPANRNPFSMNLDETIHDGTQLDAAPAFFKQDNDAYGVVAKEDDETISPELTQEEAELLVQAVFKHDPLFCVAIKEEFSHIIPIDLKTHVMVTSSKTGVCDMTNVWYLK